MSAQYVLVGHPYSEVQSEAVGPFRSEVRAQAAADRINARNDKADGVGGYRLHDGYVYVVLLKTEAEWIDEFIPTPTEEADHD